MEDDYLLDAIRATVVGLLALAALASSGCHPGGELEPELIVEGPVEVPTRPTGPSLTLDALPTYLSFTAAPDLLQDVGAAVGRWRDATGIDIRVVEAYGIELVTMPQVVVDGNEVCGWARLSMGQIWLATDPIVTCPEQSLVIAHEMGHAIRGDGGHSDDGLMASGKVWATTRLIDETSLDLVCGLAPCTRYATEKEESNEDDSIDSDGIAGGMRRAE